MSREQYSKKEYALYKGDEFLTIGTLEELAKYLGINYRNILKHKANQTKYIFVDLGKEVNKE